MKYDRILTVNVTSCGQTLKSGTVVGVEPSTEVLSAFNIHHNGSVFCIRQTDQTVSGGIHNDTQTIPSENGMLKDI